MGQIYFKLKFRIRHKFYVEGGKMNQKDKRNWEKFQEILKEHQGNPDELIQVLNEAQEIFKVINKKVQIEIGNALRIPLAKVIDTTTYYQQSSIENKGENVIGVCLGTACYVKGSQSIVKIISEKLGIQPGETTNDKKFTLVVTRCVGACSLAPVVTINEEVYGKVSEEDINRILDIYIKK